MSSQLAISHGITRDGTIVLLRLSGKLCAATVPALRQALGTGERRQGLILDLSGVGSVDAVGLRALFGEYCDAAQRRCPFVFICPGPGIRTALEAAGVEVDRVL